MAKNSDHRADGFDADDSGGVLGGLLAEEDDFDRRALWRIGSWGVGATGAVILAVMANQSSLGLKRDQVAAADLTRQAQQIQSVARETQNEARRLAAAIDTLNSDRDRLYSRVTSLEHRPGLRHRRHHPAGFRAGFTSRHEPSRTAAHGPPAPAVAPVGTTQIGPVADKPAASAAEPGPTTVSSVAKARIPRKPTPPRPTSQNRMLPRVKLQRPKLPNRIAERPTPQSSKSPRLHPRRR